MCPIFAYSRWPLVVASRPASPHPSRLLGLALRLSRSCLSMPPGNPRRAGGWHLRKKPCVKNFLYVPFFFPVAFSHLSSVFFFLLAQPTASYCEQRTVNSTPINTARTVLHTAQSTI